MVFGWSPGAPAYWDSQILPLATVHTAAALCPWPSCARVLHTSMPMHKRCSCIPCMQQHKVLAQRANVRMLHTSCSPPVAHCSSLALQQPRFRALSEEEANEILDEEAREEEQALWLAGHRTQQLEREARAAWARFVSRLRAHLFKLVALIVAVGVRAQHFDAGYLVSRLGGPFCRSLLVWVALAACSAAKCAFLEWAQELEATCTPRAGFPAHCMLEVAAFVTHIHTRLCSRKQEFQSEAALRQRDHRAARAEHRQQEQQRMQEQGAEGIHDASRGASGSDKSDGELGPVNLHSRRQHQQQLHRQLRAAGHQAGQADFGTYTQAAPLGTTASAIESPTFVGLACNRDGSYTAQKFTKRVGAGDGGSTKVTVRDRQLAIEKTFFDLHNRKLDDVKPLEWQNADYEMEQNNRELERIIK
eukprot:scaffold111460_cov19-Tisochrysis_lutea.AAC.1